MKKIYLSLFILLFSMTSWADTMTIDFESDLDKYTDWSFTYLYKSSTDITAHGGTYFGKTDGRTTASITTNNKIAKPSNISFYISKATTNTTDSDWKIQVSSDNATWTTLKTQSAKTMSKGEWVNVTQDLSLYSDVYVRIYYSGSTSQRCIDDITLTYNENSGSDDPRTAVNITSFTADNTELSLQQVTSTNTSVSNSQSQWTPSYTYSSSDEKVAIVSNTGVITAVGEGTAEITVSLNISDDDANYKKGNTSSKSITITVVNPNIVYLPEFTTKDGNIRSIVYYNAYDGDGSTHATVLSNRLTLYQRYPATKMYGGYVIIKAPGYKIKKVQWTSGIKSTFAYTVDVNPQNSSDITLSKDMQVANGAVATISGLDASSVTIYARGTDSSDRVYMNDLTVYIEQETSYSRTVSDGDLGTICLPYAVAEGDYSGAEFFEIAYKDANDIYFSEATSLEAGKPYIFKATADEIVMEYSGNAVATAGNHNGLYGTFERCPFTTLAADGDIYIVNSYNEVQKASTNSGVNANRAYIRLSEVPTVPAGAAPRFALRYNNVADGICENVSANNTKFINYNLSGQRVDENAKGIIIMNGKKVKK